MSTVNISVIVPVYGVEKFMERSCKSLFEQTMTDGVEFIFVNDATPDNSIHILNNVLARYPHRQSQVTVINQPTNKGVAAARIKGMSVAKGEYLFQCDSDDFFEPDMLQAMFSKARENNADIVVADFFISYNNKDVYRSCRLGNTKEELVTDILNSEHGIGSMLWNKLIKKSIYDRYSIQVVERLNVCEDVIVIVPAVYYARSIIKINKAFVHYNKQNLNSYTSHSSSEDAFSRLGNLANLDKFIRKHNLISEENFNSYIFKQISIILLYCNYEDQKKLLDTYPHITYKKYGHTMQWYWKIPMRLAFNRHLRVFNCLKYAVLKLRYAYRSLR